MGTRSVLGVIAILAILVASVAVAVSSWVPIQNKYFTGFEFLEVATVPNIGDFGGGGAFWYPIPEVVLKHGNNLWVVDVLSKSYKHATLGAGRSAGIWVCVNNGNIVDYGYWYIEEGTWTNTLWFLNRELIEVLGYPYDFPALEPGGIGDNVIFLSSTTSGSTTNNFAVVKVECTPQFSVTFRRISLTLPSGYSFKGRPLAIGYAPTLVFAVVENAQGDYGLAFNVVSDIMTATTVQLSYFTDFDLSFGVPLYGYIEAGRAVIGLARGYTVSKYIIDLATLTYETITINTNLPYADWVSDVGFAGVITEDWLVYYTIFDNTGVHFIDTQVPMRLPWYLVNPSRYSLGGSYRYNALPTLNTGLINGIPTLKAGVLLLYTEPPVITETQTVTETETVTGAVITETVTYTITVTRTEVVPIPMVETVTETTTVTTTVAKGVAIELPTLLLVLLVVGVVLVIVVARRY